MVVQRQLVLVQVGGWVVGSRHTIALGKLCATAQKSINYTREYSVICNCFTEKFVQEQFWCIVLSNANVWIFNNPS